MRNLFMLTLAMSFSSMICPAAATFSYREEFKAFETNPRYRVIFDKEANSSLRAIQSAVQNYKELSFFQRMVRTAFFGFEVVVATPETMPKLHGFIAGICESQAVETPTVFIAKNKGLFNAAASKLLASSGAIVISQKLIEETTDKELQGVVAHELGHIVYNHINKRIVISIGSYYVAKWAKEYITGTQSNAFDDAAYYIGLLVIAPCLINKRFEKEADEFAYRVTDNGEGLIEFFEHLEKIEEALDNDFDATKAIVQENYSNIGFLDYSWLMARYYLSKTGHNIGKGFAWVYHHTPLGAHPTHEDRIKAAQEYLAEKQA